MPVNPCILVRSAKASCDTVRRPIDLHGCADCGFLWNAAFDETVVTYDQTYEGTQSHSAYFQRYLQQTAAAWSAELGPDVDAILEVGCGQGEFLDVLADKTKARLVGYDPAYRQGGLRRAAINPERLPASPKERFPALVNRMTLEHIADPFTFVSHMAEWLTDDGCLVTQVPNAERMVTNMLYCDLIYEHVNYFNAFALVRLFERAGFENNTCHLSYDNQHLTVFSRRSPKNFGSDKVIASQAFDAFSAAISTFRDDWSDRLARIHDTGSDVFIWGAGSRATTFINALRNPEMIAGAIDINPNRTGTFVQGTACETHLPEILRNRANVKVIAMNPIYATEISCKLREISSCAELIS
ncbi:class I SAM-dependent methyltransferase [Loktanella sp. 5RATIMAR09]|uniref:class I SAM-dependent methyltransferase n=1 Tax=Loktanella sp. 5RATIMAR09 TaxID=1225655 RepID=UPI00155F2436|nr:class I SAM-dependent methyltransferase [Loktanella sp. 5RATIMAR09]